jgi:hypothetical protein
VRILNRKEVEAKLQRQREKEEEEERLKKEEYDKEAADCQVVETLKVAKMRLVLVLNTSALL